MDNGKKNALAQITAVANNRYNNLVTGDTRLKLFKLLSLKRESTNYSAVLKDIERIVITYVKESGHQTMVNLVNNIKEMNSESADSLVILHEISQFDQAGIIKKSLKSFKYNKKATVQVPHELKVLFDSEKINMEDIQKYEKEIKATCNLTDDFFIRAVQSDSKFQNYEPFVVKQNNQYQTQQINNGFVQPQQQFNPYQNLSMPPPCQAILPPAQTPIFSTVSGPIGLNEKVPIVSPTQVPMPPNQNIRNSLPQYYYLTPPYQPPPSGAS